MPKVQKTVMITEEQAEWVDETSWFNLSGFVQDRLDERIEKEVSGGSGEDRTI